MKLAAVHHALAGSADIEHVIVHTGQHYDPLFSDIFFTQLAIPEPQYNLGIKGGDREEVIRATAEAFLPVLQKEQPDIVLVYGDVNGAVGAARAAKTLGIRIAHIEAGLRSFDPDMPEELNRIEIDRSADELFTTEPSAGINILREGIKGHVHFVGNTMIDTLVRMQPVIREATLPFDPPDDYVVVTLHRPSNVDDPAVLRDIFVFLQEISQICPVVIPLHLRTKATIETHGLQSLMTSFRVIEPLGYVEFLRLLSDARCILTDSGGIQEEATFLKKRCFTLRRNTERPSTVKSGSNVLIDPANDVDRQKVIEFLSHPEALNVQIPELWDGRAGERILSQLLLVS